MSLLEYSKTELKSDEPLSKHVTFGIGGHARFFAEPANLQELKGLLEFIREENLTFSVLGNGSNILFRDNGFSGVVISMKKYDTGLKVYGSDFALVSAGKMLSSLVKECEEMELGGLEFLADIPGTVGGAIIMNAGYGRNEGGAPNTIGDFVEEITMVDLLGEEKVLGKKNLSFAYRKSDLMGNIIISAKLRLSNSPRERIAELKRKYREERGKSQPIGYRSAGCVFKNPLNSNFSAGELIDKAGLKGLRMGGAEISNVHANFIINRGGATATDVLALINKARNVVREKFAVDLETEIDVMGGGSN